MALFGGLGRALGGMIGVRGRPTTQGVTNENIRMLMERGIPEATAIRLANKRSPMPTGQVTPAAPGGDDPNDGPPPVPFAPLQGEAKARWDAAYNDWQSRHPGMTAGQWHRQHPFDFNKYDAENPDWQQKSDEMAKDTGFADYMRNKHGLPKPGGGEEGGVSYPQVIVKGPNGSWKSSPDPNAPWHPGPGGEPVGSAPGHWNVTGGGDPRDLAGQAERATAGMPGPEDYLGGTGYQTRWRGQEAVPQDPGTGAYSGPATGAQLGTIGGSPGTAAQGGFHGWGSKEGDAADVYRFPSAGQRDTYDGSKTGGIRGPMKPGTGLEQQLLQRQATPDSEA